MLLRILDLIGALALLKVVNSASCFLPDGSINATDVPCIGNDGTSRCCGPDELCSSNKLCVSKADHNKFSRGSCLDKSFGPTCPNFCKGIDDAGKVTVLPCGTPSLGEFCCDDGKGFQCCETQTSILTLGAVTVFSEAPMEFTSMSVTKSSAVTTPASMEFTSMSATRSNVVTTSASIAAITTSEALGMRTSAVASSLIDLSSLQGQPPIESLPIASTSRSDNSEPVVAPPRQPSDAASSSTSQFRASIESHIPNSTITQSVPSTSLIPSSTAALQTSSIATSVIAGAIDSKASTSSKGNSTVVVAGYSVAILLAIASLTILGLFCHRKRKAKRISKRFEISLGRTNILDEKGLI